jgi:hypothetical protein
MKVFLSYAGSERQLAENIRHDLAAAGISVWDAVQEIVPGENWPKKVGKALDESNAMVVLISPEAVRSRWIKREIDYALGSPRFEGRLIPVLARPTRDIPWILQRMNIVQHAGEPRKTTRQLITRLKLPKAAFRRRTYLGTKQHEAAPKKTASAR